MEYQEICGRTKPSDTSKQLNTFLKDSYAYSRHIYVFSIKLSSINNIDRVQKVDEIFNVSTYPLTIKQKIARLIPHQKNKFIF